MNINFPTSFAINIAKENKLYTNKAIPRPRYPEEEPIWRVSDKAGYQHERLAMFQSVSLSQPFDECLKIYLEIELSKKQIKALRKIHKATPLWIQGKMISGAFATIDKSRNTYGYARTVIDQAEVMINVLGMRNDN